MRHVTACLLVASLSFACEAPSEVEQAGESGTSEADPDVTGAETSAGEASYPAGPYGTEVGDVVGNLSFVDGDDIPVELAALYGGSQRALVLFGTAAWCGVCITEAEELTVTLSTQSANVFPLGVLYEDALGGKPTAAVAKAYDDAIEAFEFVADPSQSISDFFDPAGQLPRLLIIDTATMTLVYKNQGFDVAALLAAIETVSAG